MTRTAPLFALIALAACNENGLNNLPGDEGVGGRIEVAPPLIAYGTLEEGEEDVKPFLITNVGTASLLVEDLIPGGSSSFTLIDPPTNFLLPVGASETINVRFSPLGANDQIGHVLVLSQDPETPETRVDLQGIGAVPELEIDPPAYDFSADFVGCGDSVDLTLRNVGTDDLVIEDLDYLDPDGQLALISALTLPISLSPGESVGVVVEWNPSHEVTANGELSVTSNDPRGIVTATQEAEGVFATVKTDTFQVPTDPPVDILFAVDQSCSMDGHSTQLSTAFNGLISQMSTVTNDWRVGVATNDNGCFNSGVLSPSTPGLATVFADAVRVGADGQAGFANTEKLFLVAKSALTQTASGGCNAGFLRSNALLHIILVSDEPEQSNTSSASFVTAAQYYKSSPALVKVSGLICTTCGGASPYGYAGAVTQTGGITLDVMQTYWGNYAQQLAAASLAVTNEFQLDDFAAPDSIRVWVNGTEVTTGWTYNDVTHEIVFDTAPPQGADIEVEYGLLMCN